jgi:hypothetical protein
MKKSLLKDYDSFFKLERPNCNCAKYTSEGVNYSSVVAFNHLDN